MRRQLGHQQARGRRPRVLLLPSNEPTVRNGVGRKGRSHFKIRIRQLARFAFDLVGLDALTDGLVGDLLFGVGKSRPAFALDQ